MMSSQHRLLASLLVAGALLSTITASRADGIPTDPEALGKTLCEAVDLATPGLESMNRLASEGKYTEAMNAWRDYKVAELRKAPLGEFGWHGDQQNGRRLAIADLLVGKIDTTAYEKVNPPEKSLFIDRYGMRGPVDGAKPIDWLARTQGEDLSVEYASGYANFFFAIPFAVRYWQQGDPVYLSKFFQIAGDFAVRQKALVNALPAGERNQVACGWSIRAPDALSECDRVSSLIRILGLLAKSLPDTAPKVDWANALAPRDVPLKAGSDELFPAPMLAELALSLVNDHPPALKQRYLKAGAVPNQRKAGLLALLEIATTFPEFKFSKPMLGELNVALEDYLKGAHHQDGGLLEQSFNYNLRDVEGLTSMADCIRPINPELAAELQKQQVASYRALASLSEPVGQLPGLASYRAANPPPIWKDPNARVTWQKAQSSVRGGKSDPLMAQIGAGLGGSGTGPAFTSIALPFSGYYVQRGGWNWDDPYLFFHGSRPSRGHHVMGKNGVQLTAYGRPLLVYGGAAVYSAGQLPVELRPQFNAINELLGEDSSWKANTLLVDGASQNYPARDKLLQAAPNTTVDALWFTSPTFDYVEGFHNEGYVGDASRSGATHRRQAVFLRDPGIWILVDSVNSTDGKPHEFIQNWTLPGNETNGSVQVHGFGKEQLSADTSARILRTADPEGPNLTLMHAGLKDGDLRYISHYGERNPWRGWYSYTFGGLVPAHQIEARFHATGPATLITILQPRRTGENEDLAVTDLSRPGHPEKAACRVTLPGNRTVTVQAGNKLEVTVSGPSGSDGLVVTGRGEKGSQAFHRASDGTTTTEPISVPTAFSWSESPAGLVPCYKP